MKEFISDLGIIPSALGPMKIFYDNTGAIALRRNPDFKKEPNTSRDASVPSAIKSGRET